MRSACPAQPASIRTIGIGRSQRDTIITALIAFRCRAHNLAQSCNSRPCKMRQPQRDLYTNMNTHTDRHNMRRHREKGRRKYARALSHVYICTPQCINDVAAAIERKRSCLHYHRLGLSLTHAHTQYGRPICSRARADSATCTFRTRASHNYTYASVSETMRAHPAAAFDRPITI